VVRQNAFRIPAPRGLRPVPVPLRPGVVRHPRRGGQVHCGLQPVPLLHVLDELGAGPQPVRRPEERSEVRVPARIQVQRLATVPRRLGRFDLHHLAGIGDLAGLRRSRRPCLTPGLQWTGVPQPPLGVVEQLVPVDGGIEAGGEAAPAGVEKIPIGFAGFAVAARNRLVAGQAERPALPGTDALQAARVAAHCAGPAENQPELPHLGLHVQGENAEFDGFLTVRAYQKRMAAVQPDPGLRSPMHLGDAAGLPPAQSTFVTESNHHVLDAEIHVHAAR